MDMFDEARAMSGTLELCKITQSELGKRLGVSQSYVANKLRLLTLSPRVQSAIRAAGVSERHARVLLRLGSEDEQLDMLDKITSRRLTVRETEALVDVATLSYATKKIEKAPSREGVEAFVSTLRDSLCTLRSFGIDVSERTGYYKNKMYITVCINGI